MTNKVDEGKRRLRNTKKKEKRESHKPGEKDQGIKEAFLSGAEARDSGALEKSKEKERSELTAFEGLRAKSESMCGYESGRSSRERLLTGAHRALIDCELCRRAQPISAAPTDFSGLEHLHAVCRLIRERGERKRQKDGKEKQG